MRMVAALAALLSLQGCWGFVYIPAGQTAQDNRNVRCVNKNVRVGDRVIVPGGGATVKSVSAGGSRCTDPELPLLAEVDPS